MIGVLIRVSTGGRNVAPARPIGSSTTFNTSVTTPVTFALTSGCCN